MLLYCQTKIGVSNKTHLEIYINL
ncbi:hypothetical protein BpHYR1_043506 [Brachionus plicatilis]|uniref:Uncharacterized protein n=1 Tax=Brachionus plicatilis TaxID=10195 RepID=A0A3M7RFF7_BRAPC|nr:hypothetical protein BpHYR1_043506 [Brachionus plicatilis]